MNILISIIVIIIVLIAIYVAILNSVRGEMSVVYTVQMNPRSYIKVSDLDKKIVKWGVYTQETGLPLEEHIFIWNAPVRKSNGMDVLNEALLKKRRTLLNRKK